MSSPVAFTGSVPQTYHSFLGPMLFEPYARDITIRLAPRENERILELACGTGIVSKEIARAMPLQSSLVATDLNEAMLNVAKPNVGPDTRVSFQVVDACSLPFADNSFDAMVCQYGVMFFPEKIRSMLEARRVLKPGGRYIFNVWDSLEFNPLPGAVNTTLTALFPASPPQFLAKTPYGYFDQAEIERVVRAGGFTECNIETIEYPCTAPTAEHVARAFIEGTPILSALQERGVTDPAPVRQAVTAVLAKQFGANPCRSTMRAIVVSVS